MSPPCARVMNALAATLPGSGEVKAEKIIREEVTKCGLACHDILWTFHKLEVTVMRAEGDGPEEEASYVDSDKLMEAIRWFGFELRD